MSRIRVLDAEVVDRIAAGEVVERPASVVKELVENALDAGARRIDIRVEAGGRRLVEVADDGHGMDRADARLAFAQHATSKIARVEDLEAVMTLGFRGEALPSVAAVSRVELLTGTGQGPGVRVRVEGGRVVAVEAVAWPRGTTVRVADLFFNTPARRKHLRRQATEFGHVAVVAEAYALARPRLHLTLRHGGRRVLAAPPAEGLRERVHQVLGEEVAAGWLPVELDAGQVRIRGGVAGPEVHRPNRRHLHWFVNGRPVADARLAHAVASAFEPLLQPGRYPVAVLAIDLPAAEVDVNVHPRKAEVRLLHAGRVHDLVRAAVRRALAGHLPPPLVRMGRRAGPVAVAEGPSHAALPLEAEGAGGGAVGPETLLREGSADEAAAPVAEGAERIRGTLRPLGQYANTYIVAADDEGLLIVDQHVAHERVLFEGIMARLQGAPLEVQHLLVPEPLELTGEEAAALEAAEELVAALGFSVEPFGGATWLVRTAPALLGPGALGPALRQILESVQLGEEPGALEAARRRAAATLACHAAVRARHPLTAEEMAALLADLARCAAPTRCPHGRPILLRLRRREIERLLGRRPY